MPRCRMAHGDGIRYNADVFFLFIIVTLIYRAFRLAVMAGVVLHYVDLFMRPNWTQRPLAKAIMVMCEWICAPFRQLMKSFGIPTKPLDLSPAVAILVMDAGFWILMKIIFHR